jgi:gas vesicle protein
MQMIRKEQIIGGMVFGALVGGVSAILLAPRSGRENREALQDKMGGIKARMRRNHLRGDEELP